MPALALVLALGVPVARAQPAQPAPTFDLAPPEAWIDPLEVPPAPASVDSGGVDDLLDDTQVRVAGPDTRVHRHRAWRVSSGAGVERGSELRISFDPTYEALVLHHVRIVRGAEVLDALRREDVRVIQQENDLDARIYDGSFTALLFLRDVRAGDVIDAAWTVKGANPVFGNEYAGHYPLGGARSVERLRVRLLHAADRRLEVRLHGLDHAPQDRVIPAGRERIWEFRPARAFPYEPGAPEWHRRAPWLQVTSHASWATLVDWARPLFEVPVNESPLLDERLRGLRAIEGDEARFLATVAFVQDEVRYLGIELGRNSHEPHPPAQVLSQRFGDCKDKSFLLVTLLRALGFEAHVALVNTRARRTLDARLPSHYEFDHAIVHAKVSGREVWVDATSSYVRGSLAGRVAPPFERALVIAPGVTALVPMPLELPQEPLVDTHEHFTIGASDAPVTLEVTKTYRSTEANRARHHLASTSPSEFNRRTLDYLDRLFGNVTARGPAEIADDPAANVVVVKRTYELAKLAADGARRFEAHTFDESLARPPLRERTSPLGLDFPAFDRHVVVLDGPGLLQVATDEGTLKSDALDFAWSVERTGGGAGVELTWTLRSLADSVPADKLAAHLEVLEQMRKHADVAVGWDRARSAKAARNPAAREEAWVLLGLLGLITLGVGLRAGPPAWRRWRQRSASKPGGGKGFSVASPVTCNDLSEVSDALSALKCSCQGRLKRKPRFDVETIPAGDRMVVPFDLVCERCGQPRRAFVSLPAEEFEV